MKNVTPPRIAVIATAFMITALMVVMAAWGFGNVMAEPKADGGAVGGAEPGSGLASDQSNLSLAERTSRDLRQVLKRSITELPPVFLKPGPGVITGRIVEAYNAKPMPGIEVTATAKVWTLPRSTFRPGPDLYQNERQLLDAYIELAAGAIEMFPLGGHLRSKAVTDADGKFELKGLGDFDYRVTTTTQGIDFAMSAADLDFTTRPGGRPSSTGQTAWTDAKSGDVVKFFGAYPPGVRLTVLMPDGTIVDHNEVDVRWTKVPEGMDGRPLDEVFAAGKVHYSGRRDSNLGIYALDPGTWVMQAEPIESLKNSLVGPGYAKVTFADRSIPVEIKLTKIPGVVAAIENHASEWDLSVLEFYCIRVADDFEISQWRLDMAYGFDLPENAVVRYWLRTSTRKMPTHIGFPNPKAGRSLIIALVEGKIMGHTFAVVDADKQHYAVLKLLPLARSECVEVIATGPGGIDIDGGLVAETVVSMQGHVTARSKLQGKSIEGKLHVALPLFEGEHSREELEEVTWKIQVTHPKYGSVVKSFTPSAETTVEIKFLVPATFKIEISGLAEHPAKQYIAVGESKSADHWPEFKSVLPISSELIGKDTISLGPVQPGPFELALFLAASSESMEIASKSVVATSGENAVTLDLPKLFRVELVGKAMTSRRMLTLERPTSAFDRNSTSVSWDIVTPPATYSKGKANFPFLPVGEYRAKWWDASIRSHASKTFTVSEAMTVNLDE